MTVDEIISAINELSVLELVEMKNKLQDQWGVTAAAPVAVAVAAGDAAAPEVEEQYAFNVTLSDVGAEKIQVIKVVREITSLGLKEAKELVEAAPGAVLVEEVTKEEAAAVKDKIEAVGGKVEIK
jgi:large subunit ribosomal protein L7/L12